MAFTPRQSKLLDLNSGCNCDGGCVSKKLKDFLMHKSAVLEAYQTFHYFRKWVMNNGIVPDGVRLVPLVVSLWNRMNVGVIRLPQTW